MKAERVWAKLRRRIHDNDARWLAWHVAAHAFRSAGLFAERRARAGALRRRLPGTNTRAENAKFWDAYDWSRGGDEWTVSSSWRRSVVDDLMLPRLGKNPIVLEIGPGAGRWSGDLLRGANELILADISETALSVCKARFTGADNIKFCLTDGRGFPTIANDAVDFVWSFDVFVHIAPADQEKYLLDIARVMRPGACGVIHHSGRASTLEGWRSAMTGELFGELVRNAGMRVAAQFDRPVQGLEFTAALDGDVITVFER